MLRNFENFPSKNKIMKNLKILIFPKKWGKLQNFEKLTAISKSLHPKLYCTVKKFKFSQYLRIFKINANPEVNNGKFLPYDYYNLTEVNILPGLVVS